jgi:hypothetical protein
VRIFREDQNRQALIIPRLCRRTGPPFVAGFCVLGLLQITAKQLRVTAQLELICRFGKEAFARADRCVETERGTWEATTVSTPERIYKCHPRFKTRRRQRIRFTNALN